MDPQQKENKLRAINNAIWFWQMLLQGHKFWYDKKTYTKEWCAEQIQYFEGMKEATEKE